MFNLVASQIVIAQPSNSDVVVIKHSKGETKVPANPKKVLIMDLSALETYYELGIPVMATVDQKITDIGERLYNIKF